MWRRLWRITKPKVFVRDQGKEYWSLQIEGWQNFWQQGATTRFSFFADGAHLYIRGIFFVPPRHLFRPIKRTYRSPRYVREKTAFFYKSLRLMLKQDRKDYSSALGS